MLMLAVNVLINIIDMIAQHLQGLLFHNFFPPIDRWQHDVVRSNHLTCPCDHNIVLLGTTSLACYRIFVSCKCAIV